MGLLLGPTVSVGSRWLAAREGELLSHERSLSLELSWVLARVGEATPECLCQICAH